jgi:hypothetical protein
MNHHLPVPGLDGYLRAVAAAVDVPVEAAWSDTHPPATAYLPLPHRSPERPDHDLLLVWGERDGWLAAADTAPTEPPIVLAYLGQDVLPAPDTVRRFVADMTAGRHPGQLNPPGFRDVDDHDDLAERLAAYQTRHRTDRQVAATASHSRPTG